MTITQDNTLETEPTHTNGVAPKRSRRPAAPSEPNAATDLRAAKERAHSRLKELRAEVNALEAELGITAPATPVRGSDGRLLGHTVPMGTTAPGYVVSTRSDRKTAVKAKPRAEKPKADRAKRGSKTVLAAEALEKIVAALKEESPLRSEKLREVTGIDKAIIGLALKRGIDTGTISSVGKKRATEYSLANAE